MKKKLNFVLICIIDLKGMPRLRLNKISDDDEEVPFNRGPLFMQFTVPGSRSLWKSRESLDPVPGGGGRGVRVDGNAGSDNPCGRAKAATHGRPGSTRRVDSMDGSEGSSAIAK